MEMLDVGDTRLRLDTQPSVVLFIGVNGVGKTTTIGKLAKQLGDQGETGADVRRRYLPGRRCRSAGDLGRRTGADIVRQHEGRTLPPWFMTESSRPRPDMPT